MEKKTVGAAALELQQKQPDTLDPIELQREMQKDYVDNLIECVQTNRKDITGNFYVVVLTKMERLLTNVFRNFFFARISCPTPDYDQAVYKYNADSETLDYIWCIPDRDTSYSLKLQALEIDDNEKMLLQHVLDFSDGTLFTLSKKLNKENMYSNLLEN